jgi:uncharacterized protein HemX
MTDEIRTTTHETTRPGDTTIIRETRTGGGGGWAIAIVLVLALIAGIWFFSRTSSSEAAKDNAITNAANNVGEAARDVGAAAQDAADNVKEQ